MASADDINANVITYAQFKVDGVLFEAPVVYQLIKPVGKGAYGLVCSALNKSNSQNVAIKKIGDVFSNLLDARRTLREIRMLQHLNGHPNIVNLIDVYPPPTGSDAKDVYCVYELLDSDLHQLIRSPQPLTISHIQLFIYQLLRGLKYIHSAGIMHRDLNPSNLLINANCMLKLCDFGLARQRHISSANGNDQHVPEEYVVTRWYRAPELLLSCSSCTSATDLWSVGCILAELLGRKPLFPGKDYVHCLNLICKVIGTPTAAEIEAIDGEKAKTYLKCIPRMEKTDLRLCFPQATADALDMLTRLLAFNPRDRLTAEQALQHPFVAHLHDPTDEPCCPRLMPADPELDHMGAVEIQRAILQEMKKFNPLLEAL